MLLFQDLEVTVFVFTKDKVVFEEHPWSPLQKKIVNPCAERAAQSVGHAPTLSTFEKLKGKGQQMQDRDGGKGRGSFALPVPAGHSPRLP
jgi:hypothetical protein